MSALKFACSQITKASFYEMQFRKHGRYLTGLRLILSGLIFFIDCGL